MNGKLFGLIFGIIVISAAPTAFGLDVLKNTPHEEIVVLMDTRSGNIWIEFFPDDAPNHVANFLNLANEGFYDDTFFHRIIEGFMVQGGDPKTKFEDGGNFPDFVPVPESEWGTGGPGYSIEAEFNTLKHDRGMVSMARSVHPDSAGSQFFIVHKDSHFLDGQYTVFGRIYGGESFDTLERMATKVDLVGEKPENPKQVMINKIELMPKKFATITPSTDPPNRTDNSGLIQISGPQTYESQRLGVKFLVPEGWFVQEPPKRTQTSPDIAATGPMGLKIPISLTLLIEDTNSRTFQQVVEDKKNGLQPRIDDGSLKIHQFIDESLMSGKEHFTIFAEGFFAVNNEDITVNFAETAIYTDDKIYTFSTSSDSGIPFSEQTEILNDVIDSFKLVSKTSGTMASSPTPASDEGGGCLIATAAYGSEMAPQVQFLREIRDGKIMTTQSGTAFMTGFNQFYYSFSPAVADYERENPVFKEAVKLSLTPLLTSLSILNYVDIDTEQEVLGYGIGVILLNIGMYFVAPAAVIIAIKNRRK